jgi:SAM-dependent MidA family methyltransferase
MFSIPKAEDWPGVGKDPSPAQVSDRSSPPFRQRIADLIRQSPEQRISFATYMEQVLYDPQYGYYASNPVKIGPAGDFFTSPYLGTDFAELLGEQCLEMWQQIGLPPRFDLVEMGAGQGVLAADMLAFLEQRSPNFWAALQYRIVEKSPALRAEQQQRLEVWDRGAKVCWQPLEQLPENSITGCFFSNELVDAFPVHRVVVHQGKLQEIYVETLQNAPTGLAFGEVSGPLSTPRLKDYFSRLGIDLESPIYPEGYKTEVNLAALDWLDIVSGRLKQGYLLTIDYGYTASQYYSPARVQGTLQCYFQHSSHANPYIHLGSQDMTAHVDFTALQRQGEEQGLQTLGFTQQGLFLMGLGLGDRLLANNSGAASADLTQVLHRREALHLLINPLRLGGFGVLIQGKGLFPDAPVLKGLSLK